MTKSAKENRTEAINTLADLWWKEEVNHLREMYDDSLGFDAFVELFKSHALYAIWILMNDGKIGNKEAMLEVYYEVAGIDPDASDEEDEEEARFAAESAARAEQDAADERTRAIADAAINRRWEANQERFRAEQGAFDWTAMDAAVDAAVEEGVDTTLTVGKMTFTIRVPKVSK
jgi:hypothetical protein